MHSCLRAIVCEVRDSCADVGGLELERRSREQRDNRLAVARQHALARVSCRDGNLEQLAFGGNSVTGHVYGLAPRAIQNANQWSRVRLTQLA